MSIKVIAPLSPAGDFPLADAQNISFNPNAEPTAGTVEAALMALQREVGGEGGSTPESLTAKLDRTLDKVDLVLEGLGYEHEYIPEDEDISSRIARLADSLGAIMNQFDGNKVGGIREAVNDIYDLLAEEEGGLRDKIDKFILANDNAKEEYQKLTVQIGSACDKLDSAVSAFSASADALTSVVENLQTELLADLGTFKTETSTEINDLKSSIESRFDTLSETTGTKFDSLSTTINDKVDTLSESLTGNATTLSTNVVKAVTDMQADLNSNYQEFSATLQDQYDKLDSTLTAKYNTLSGQYTNMQNDMSAKYEALSDDYAKLATTVDTNFNSLTAGVAEAASDAILGDVQETLKTSLSTEVSNTMSELILALRSHINTALPPKLTVSPSTSTCLYNSTPSIDIIATVNRPLEPPLQLIFGSKAVSSSTREYEHTWTPSLDGNYTKLPKSVSMPVRIIQDDPDANDSYICAEEYVKCTFAANIYYGFSDSPNCDDPEKLVDKDNKKVQGYLSDGHPASLSFNKSGYYCYYMCPRLYGVPTISSGGLSAGFISQGTWTNNDGILYDIYRSEYKLNGTTVSIK